MPEVCTVYVLAVPVGSSDKLSKAINTNMYHECGLSVWLGKSTGMCSSENTTLWWSAILLASADILTHPSIVLLAVLQHKHCKRSKHIFTSLELLCKKHTTAFTGNAHWNEVWLYLGCDYTLDMVDLMFLHAIYVRDRVYTFYGCAV